MKTFIQTIALLVVLTGLIAYGFYVYVTIPYVHKSWSTQKCLFVEYHDGTISESACKNLPSRYELVWNK